MFFTLKSASALLPETPYQRIYKIQQLTRENRHCLRQASSRLVSYSSRIAHPRIIHAERLISSPRIPLPFSARQVRWNSSNNESPVKPTRTLEKEVEIQKEASVEERQRKEPAHSRQIEETEVEDDFETQAVERPAAPGKREMRMHTLNTRMQEQPEYFGPRESDTIYVGNIFYDVEAEDLRARMEKFGTVIQAVIVHDNRGLSKG